MGLRYVGGIISAGLNGINYPVTSVEYLVVAGGVGRAVQIKILQHQQALVQAVCYLLLATL